MRNWVWSTCTNPYVRSSVAIEFRAATATKETERDETNMSEGDLDCASVTAIMREK